MCGICGIINADRAKRVQESELVKMRDVMSPRGPDDAGMYIDGSAGFAHRRLSIIDLANGHQPMCNEDGTIWVVFNGEIYNFKTIRDELISNGHKFTTNSDTEVLLHLYEEYGTGFPKYLQGMFAFGIWDSKNQRFFAARDRLGIKPFYYSVSRERIVFASEIKSILKCEGVTREANYDLIPEYLIFRFIAGEETLFKGIKSLLPGCTLIWERGNVATRKYWRLPVKHTENEQLSIEKALMQFDYLLGNSVRRRLLSDVPLGTLNSGGLDSSLVTAYAAEMKQDRLNTYSIGFGERKYDESGYASLVSDRFRTTHHPLAVSALEFARALPVCAWYNDEPLNHANSVLILLICKLAKERVTVLLTGEGADELLGGYPRYWLLVMQRWLPRIIRTAVALGLTSVNGHYSRKLKEFLPMSNHESLLFNSSFVIPQSVRCVLKKRTEEFSFRYRNAILEDAQKVVESLLQSALQLDIHTYLVSILHRMDRMSMAASVEARIPFLDHELVEFSMGIPDNWKMSIPRLNTKAFLKKLAVKKLPRAIVFRKKSGFGVPVSQWLKDPKGLKPFLNLLLNKRCRERGIFDVNAVESIIGNHLYNGEDHSELLWNLINLELWFELFIDRIPSQQTAEDFGREILGLADV